MSPSYIVSPSADARATALSIAWIIANEVELAGQTHDEAAKKRADLVGELAGRILAGLSDQAVSSHAMKRNS
jgi:hypothetical protein